jgi:hypothetical protein
VFIYCTITAFTRNGIGRYTGNGRSGTNAELYQHFSPSVESSGDIYFVDRDNNFIRVVYASGTINTFAGNVFKGGSSTDKCYTYSSIGGYPRDGELATNAELNGPMGVTVSSNDIGFISDTFNNRIRIVFSNDTIETYTVNGIQGYYGKGEPATGAELSCQFIIALSQDSDLYIADIYNNGIRVIFTNGTIGTFTRNGNTRYLVDNGPATSSGLNDPVQIAFAPSGEIYIADSFNGRICILVNSPSSEYSNHGYYQSQNYCLCETGYTVDCCQYSICFGQNEIYPSECSGHVTCIAPDTRLCNPGYVGDNCCRNTRRLSV